MPVGIQSFQLDDVNPLYDGHNTQKGNDVVMASGQASSLTPTTRHPPGTVLIKKTSTGKYYLSTDVTNCDSPSAASVNTLITNPGSGGWDGDLVISGHWGSLTVALSGANTDAAVAAAIIAAAAALNPESQAPITAADATGSVSISNVDVGSGTWIHARHTTVTTMLGANGTGDNGTDPDVRVLADFCDLADINGTAADSNPTPTYTRGNFRTASMASMSAEARGVLERRGSNFYPLGA